MNWVKKPIDSLDLKSVPGCGRHCRCKKSGCRMNNPFFCYIKVNPKPCSSLTCFIQAGS